MMVTEGSNEDINPSMKTFHEITGSEENGG